MLGDTSLHARKTALCVALDMPDAEEAAHLACTLKGAVDMVKIGMELFYAAGEAGYRQVAAAGLPVFLDLKLHDIPNTVFRALQALMKLDPPPAIVNVHAAGGSAMMTLAKEATAGRCRVIAVTVLTALDDEDLRAIGCDPALNSGDLVLQRARLAQESGLDGVVCSPREVSAIKRACTPDFLTVVPGIRPHSADKGDQKRIATPRGAAEAGADIIVVGRPITQAADPVTAALSIRKDLT